MTTPGLSAEPIDELRCTFVADRPFLLEEGPRKFTTLDEAAEAPPAEAVLAVDGVCEAVFSGDRVTDNVGSEPIPRPGTDSGSEALHRLRRPRPRGRNPEVGHPGQGAPTIPQARRATREAAQEQDRPIVPPSGRRFDDHRTGH